MDIRIAKPIGAGGFGAVYQYAHKDNGSFLAVKEIAFTEHLDESLFAETLRAPQLNSNYLVSYKKKRWQHSA